MIPIAQQLNQQHNLEPKRVFEVQKAQSEILKQQVMRIMGIMGRIMDQGNQIFQIFMKGI